MEQQNIVKAIGLMSGTSLDGLDIAAIEFIIPDNGSISFSIVKAVTIEYLPGLRKQLENAHHLSGLDLMMLDRSFGKFCGDECIKFMNGISFKPDLIASHGHTVFHQPSRHLTVQIGHGGVIAAIAGVPVVSDFRSLDVALHGQGAPLVPIGDQLLFSQYAYCLNLGGFANISYEEEKRIAYDICPVNIILNKFAEKLGMPYDRNGESAAKGHVAGKLLNELEHLVYYSQKAPKSLGREFITEVINPMVDRYMIRTEDFLRTFTEHIALRIAADISKIKGEVLVTGGGAHNSFLINRIRELSSNQLVIPNFQLISFKEALIFGLLGVLRYQGKINTLASVTGATEDSVGGSVYLHCR